jgi:site-specific DNA recombinase
MDKLFWRAALVSCGLCQSTCLARTTPQGHSYYMCRCSVQPLYSQRDQRCHARYSPALQLDTLVWQDLYDLLTHHESLLLALDRAQGGAWLPQDLQARRRGHGGAPHYSALQINL